MFKLTKLKMATSGQKSLRKYLLYAFGEIILIVFSLLMALQINSLNEERKKNNRLDVYKNLLAQDLTEDLIAIEKTKNQFEKELKSLNTLKHRLNNPDATLDTVYYIAKNEFSPSIPPFVNYNRGTFDALKASGDIGLLDQLLVSKLSNLIELQEEQKFYSELTIQSHGNILEDYVKSFALYKGVIEAGPVYEKIWGNTNKVELAVKLNALLTLKLSALSNAINYYEKIEVKTEPIISDLQN
ncbi:DUF6090 family protein [Marivirga sp.]|uniref:DUF6090 family protein n=1 Tax=Marivirga sp. TaxID=2018662 RepID=UPI003DA6FBA5